ncbi:MAG: DUF72 domain-containing protein [candidate division KSB1 bacterium]|nr:DUF72 domain-containing protein [candidate division KSB1 bacterium]MDZ7366305.1 DUF72 domain-containing protein [candidate division KSB1 bacterium]MDZ7403961.1 DUF72 domain-containing protein [candidate division KSB1 bacterium]
MKPPIAIGCCGFAESQDKYFAEFAAIEIQQTFYQPPGVETARRWREKAPPHFEFALKAWQLITHPATSPTYRRLRQPLSEKAKKRAGSFQPTDEVWQAWETTRQIAEALQARFIVFQCPASFAPSAENQSNLRRFFTQLQRDKFQLVWEPRGEWQAKQIHSLCEELDLIDGVDPFQRHPSFTPIVQYFRLHGIGGYRHQFTDADLRRLADWCQAAPTWAMFNNTNMLEDARRFIKRVHL